VYALTELMDRNPFALLWELLRSGMGLAIIYIQQDWFGAAGYSSLITYILSGYFLLSLFVTAWFVYRHWKEDSVVYSL
jgi:hypothetical protein